MANQEQIAQVLFVLASAFQVELTESTVLAYSIALENYPAEDIANAARYAIKTCEKMPPPATMMKFIKAERIRENRNMSLETAAEMRRTEAARLFREKNPHATANDVAEFLSSYDVLNAEARS
jgi:hypothetical protein